MFDQMRRDAEAAVALGGMRVGLPKVRVDVSQLLALLNRHDASREEIDRLRAQTECVEALVEPAYHLAKLGLQSARYSTDGVFSDAVDSVIHLTQQKVLREGE